MRISPFYLILVVLIHQHHILLASPIEDNELSLESQKVDKQCESYILAHFRKINDQLEKYENKDIEIKDLKQKFAQLEEKYIIQGEKLAQQENYLSVSEIKIQDKEETITNLKSQISFNQQTIETLLTKSKPTNKCDQLEKELSDKSEQLESCMSYLDRIRNSCREENSGESQRHNDLILHSENSHQSETQTQENLELCQNELKKLNETLANIIPNSCIPFGNAPGIHKITCGLGTINVLCDSETVGDGDGWIVIQQRINGGENFFRDWETYRNGFGSFEGDFFIGLEKLHQLTNSTQQELYIYMKTYKGRIDFVRYDNFKVGSEEEDYKLNSLGQFFSNGAEDRLSYDEHQKFSTFDRDNDESEDVNWADERRGGWWYKDRTYSNLNGQYTIDDTAALHEIFWNIFEAIPEVKMLIRSKYN